jgi:hypothetical protein
MSMARMMAAAASMQWPEAVVMVALYAMVAVVIWVIFR